MRFVADFHIHSKYSRATSPQMDLENLDRMAKIKGIKVMGTGDFTHPGWFTNLKEKLTSAEPGLFKLKKDDQGTRFILTSEISCIYSKGGKVRKVHTLIFAPSFKAVEQINTQLGFIGNLKADGRPILGLDVKELAKIALSASEDCLVIPAHCLLPNTYIPTKGGIKMIKDITIGDYVYTHKGRLKKVEKVYKRQYKGSTYKINPYYFSMGLETTPEHPFYIIKTEKYCPAMGCKTVCKKNCNSQKYEKCSHKYFKYYHPQWIQAKDIQKGDVFIYPRFNKSTKDKKEFQLSDYLNISEYRLNRGFIRPSKGMRANLIPNTIKINKDFCKLIGYYLSEGYTDNRDSISFCFHSQEQEYIDEVKHLMAKVFNLNYCRDYRRRDKTSAELIFFSTLLAKIFSRLFYNNTRIKRAHTKSMPAWMLLLSMKNQVEIFRCWWRGDAGSTVSRELMNQMKEICLRLGIIPSINIQYDKITFNKKQVKIGGRIIKTENSLFHFSNLSFFEDKFNLLHDGIFKKFNTKLKRRHGWIDENYIYMPIKDIKINEYQGQVFNLEVKDDNSYLSEFATVHNCWTPWFSLFGSKSGFDTIEECFEDYSKHIYAVETGISSDPPMSWRNSNLDKIALISNSDAHSLPKIGREANIFNTELSYNAISQALKNKDNKKFLGTIEFFPEEGRYHYDGHRACNVSLSPIETQKIGDICPSCGRPLTLGTLNRVNKLADRPEGFKPENAIGFKSLIPLQEIIAEVLGVGVGTKKVAGYYDPIISKLGSELDILLNISLGDLKQATLPEIAQAICLVRQGKVNLEPGYDGVYGKINILGNKYKKKTSNRKKLL